METEEQRNIDHRDARTLILQHGWNSTCYQILNPGFLLWFNQDRSAVIGYVRSRTHLVAAGAPVVSPDGLGRCIEEFLSFAAGRGYRVCFFGAQERTASLMRADEPVSIVPLGAQPVWHPASLHHTIQRKSSLRALVRRAEHKGTHIDLYERPDPATAAELHPCLIDWLQSRPLLPMRFLVEPDTLSLSSDRIYLAARIGDRVTGFCVATPVPRRNGWLIEQIIRRPGAPNGTAEMLLDRTTELLASRGSTMVTLGLSPLSQYAPRPVPPSFILSQLFAMTRRFGEPFYHFRGLEVFKAKFEPEEWEPVYAVSNDRYPSFGMLHAVAAAFTQGAPLRFFARSIVRSMARFLHRSSTDRG